MPLRGTGAHWNGKNAMHAPKSPNVASGTEVSFVRTVTSDVAEPYGAPKFGMSSSTKPTTGPSDLHSWQNRPTHEAARRSPASALDRVYPA